MTYARASLSLIVIVLVLGCASPIFLLPTKREMTFPERAKIPLNVELRLSADFRAAKKEKPKRYTITLGEALSIGAVEVARSLFAHVEESQSSRQDVVDAVLTPKFVFLENAAGMWARNEAVTTIAVEWVFEDSEGNVIWAQTITGEARGMAGYGGGKKRWDKMLQKRVDECIEDLFNRTYEELSSSPEIGEYAKNVSG